METVTIKINNQSYTVKAGSTILEACHEVGIDIPTLCYLKEINEIGACRICVVEVKGARSLVTACVYPVNEGMEIFTNTPKVFSCAETCMTVAITNAGATKVRYGTPSMPRPWSTSTPSP